MSGNALFQLVSSSVTGFRVMFGVEFVDPISGLPVRDGLRVQADGLGRALRPPSGRYVWLDRNPPAPRSIKVNAVSTRGEFAPFEEVLHVPAHLPNVPAAALLFRRVLVATGLLEPPPGLTAVGGQLVDGAARTPKAEVRVAVQLRESPTSPGLNDGAIVTSTYAALTDPRGGFVAVVTNLGDLVPERRNDGVATLWLRFTDAGGTVRFSELLPVRMSQYLRIPDPFAWGRLRSASPA